MNHRRNLNAALRSSDLQGGTSLSVEEQLELLRSLENRHEEVLQLIEELEARVGAIIATWGRSEATHGSLSPSQPASLSMNNSLTREDSPATLRHSTKRNRPETPSQDPSN